jgi:hypothetical protein
MDFTMNNKRKVFYYIVCIFAIFAFAAFGCMKVPDIDINSMPAIVSSDRSKVSSDENVSLELRSDQEKTTFYVDGFIYNDPKDPILINKNKSHMVSAKAKGYRLKEEFIQPPYQKENILAFTFYYDTRFNDCSKNVASIYALIVGASLYKNESEKLPAMPCVARDACQFGDLLINDLRWGEKGHIKVLQGMEATQANLRGGLDFLKKAAPDDMIVVYWSGHGYFDKLDPNLCYLACYDTDINNPPTGIRMDDVRRLVEETRATHKIIILDTCYAGSIVSGNANGIKPSPETNCEIFMTATQSGTSAFVSEGGKNSFFTYSLLKGLKGKADQEYGNKDGIVTMGELRDYITKDMQSRTPLTSRRLRLPQFWVSPNSEGIWDLSLQAN